MAKIKSCEEQWIEFRSRVATKSGRPMSENQEKTIRAAFFAGAYVAMMAVDEIARSGDGATERLTAWAADLVQAGLTIRPDQLSRN